MNIIGRYELLYFSGLINPFQIYNYYISYTTNNLIYFKNKFLKFLPGPDHGLFKQIRKCPYDPASGRHSASITKQVFYNEDIPKDESQPEAGFGGSRPERFTASRNMAELWTSFARTGKPAAGGAPDWTPYNLKERPTMRIDTKCEVIRNRYSIELDMWRSIEKLR